MGQIKITSRMRSFNTDFEESFHPCYDADGILHEERVLASECDYACASYRRTSADKGKTWTEWEKCFNDNEDGRHWQVPGSEEGDEYTGISFKGLYDPKSGCTLSMGSSTYYLKGHNVGYFDMWGKGEDNLRAHGYWKVTYPDGREVVRMFELEEGGCDYDPKNPRNPDFLDKNRCSAGDMSFLPDGDILFNLFPTVRLACKIAGVDVNGFFPSCPDLHIAMIVARAHWNGEDYEFTYSNPIMLSDLQSSRGIMEPHMTFLPDGRILLVIRGSNLKLDVWNTRIGKYTPSYKWFTISEDGGKTFAPLTPWHFDTGEVIYSSASVHKFYRCPKNGKLYWLGNIIDDPSVLDGNDPRFPLNICEVDEANACLIKETLAVIDTIRDGQTSVELSNFELLEDPDTKDLQIHMTKINFNGKIQEDGYWYSEAWEYDVEFPTDEK